MIKEVSIEQKLVQTPNFKFSSLTGQVVYAFHMLEVKPYLTGLNVKTVAKLPFSLMQFTCCYSYL